MRTKERIASYKREWQIRNKERLKVKLRKYYLLHRDEIIARSKRYREEHIDEVAAKRKLYHIKNREKIIQRVKEWVKKNPIKSKQSGKRRRLRYILRHPDKIKEMNARPAANLTDTYCRRQILQGSSIKFDVPQQLIELKRSHIKLKRLLQAT